MTSGYTLTNFHFRCGTCEARAKMLVDDATNEFTSVFCDTCGIEVTGDKAQGMYVALRQRFIDQKAKRINREILRKSGIKVPLTNIDGEFRDSRYPFILVMNPDG